MTISRNPWESRLDTVLSIVQWVTLALAVFFEAFRSGWTLATAGAALAGATYVIGFTAMPKRLLQQPIVREATAIVGSALVMGAVALTGGTDSMYLLLSLTPVLFAAAFGGLRIGLATAGLSAALLTAVTLAEQPETFPLQDLLLWTGLYLLVGVAFSHARRVLVEEREKAEALAFESAAVTRRLDRLERSYQLLSSLAQTAEGEELNPMAVGNTALDTIRSHISYEGAIVALAGDEGPVVVAKRGTDSGDLSRTMIPLSVQDREAGLVALFTDSPLTAEDRSDLDEYLRPISLAFTNILLLQEIARRAIREERARLARELHDEIGPSLASLGLALDLALLQHPTEPDLQDHLTELRGSVASLVEEVRSTVSDLRVQEPMSLTVTVERLVAAAPPKSPEVVVKLEEERPPRPALASDLGAIVTEAMRNAIAHSEADLITVHGQVNFDRGEITIHDNGKGFVRKRVADGHFGIIGMEERAQKIGADLNITSTRSGTAVSVSWGPE